MNELAIQFQVLGELRHSVFAVLYSGNLSPQLKDNLSKTYDLLQEEQAKIKAKVVMNDEGV